ncbi:MAG: C40 family peptidase [Lachnospiraceae bacterium]|nr:C40 family peptidase [Lachnospiraceae bacterium]
MRKRGFLLLLALILSVTPTLSVAADTKSEAQKQKQEAQKNLDAVNSNIENIEENKEAVQEEIVEIDAQLVDLLLTVDLITDDIKSKQGEIDVAQAEYEEARSKEEQQYESMKRRIKFMYERGEKKYIEMFLQSESIADIVNKADYVEQLYEYDRQMLLSYQQTKEEEAELKARLEEEKDELTEMQEEYVSESKHLQELIDEKKRTLEDFESQLSAAKQKAGEYQEQIKHQTAVLKQIEAEEAARRKAEEEARKKAEAEAKKKAEEDSKKKKNKNEDSDDKEKSSESDGGSDEAPKKEESSSGGGNASPGDSAKGREIADFACKYVGNPYVAGGTSLTEGCDCSGFTSAVYSHFGYSIPRNSYSQSTYGREVSYSEAQPGDIIYYGGHVGIYIGGGQIVHASTPSTGIKISNALYRSIITVRRIV